jgi:hypothetical protein
MVYTDDDCMNMFYIRTVVKNECIIWCRWRKGEPAYFGRLHTIGRQHLQLTSEGTSTTGITTELSDSSTGLQ